jgi:4-hydroxy-3-polyprenylbenzoate decarboxylase
MGYKSLHQCVLDLKKNNHLIVIDDEVDPNLEIAEIARRAYQNQSKALLFTKIKGCKFPCLSNLFGTKERAYFIFRDSFEKIKTLISLKADPVKPIKRPWAYLGLTKTLFSSLPKKVKCGPILDQSIQISDLPFIKSWPDDGGAFITLPQVLSLDQSNPTIMKANLGMYRVQLNGNDYKLNHQIGLHYQIHRGIGVHHSIALKQNEPLRVSIFVGGPPSHTLASVMPLPEGLSELMFAGAMNHRRFRYINQNDFILSAEADFCITGEITNQTLPEGPFGDHLGYYSLKHEFPVLNIKKVYARKNAIWPFTVVGRPPQEDTTFGEIIHELTDSVVSTEIPGVKALHAVDAAGVHPLLLSVGSERYAPYQKRSPQEILTQANAILGFGQCSLAKYLMIIADEDNPDLKIHHIDEYLIHLLERIDFKRDLHFQTKTTIDTLDYSGEGFNQGSKLVLAACGDKIRDLTSTLPNNLSLPEGFSNPQFALPGILLIQGKSFKDPVLSRNEITNFCKEMIGQPLDKIALIVIVDDAEFSSRNLNNFLWTTFTRSNPSHDIYGVDSFTEFKHWGCHGPMVIDARLKPYQAPPLIEDPKITEKVNQLGTKGKPLYGIV